MDLWHARAATATGRAPERSEDIWTFWKVNGGWNGIVKRIKFLDDPAPTRSGRRLEGATAA